MRRALGVVFAVLAVGGDALCLGPARWAGLSTRLPKGLGAAAQVPRAGDPPRCAYNPDGASKARPKKKKSKAPKEKVKGPPSAAALQQGAVERTFFEGAPSATETIIPGISVLTVVGIIPFASSLARQAWTRYKFTTRRVEVASGFKGQDVVQATWREVTDVKWLRRFGGAAGDMVFTLRDSAKLELRSVPNIEPALAFVMAQVADDVAESSGYPDGPATEYRLKVESGELPPPEPSDAAEQTAA